MNPSKPHSRQRPPWSLTLLWLVLMALLLGLSFWQFQRAGEKSAMLAALDAASIAAAVEVPSDAATLIALASNYRRVRLEGQYVPQRQLLWDNQIHKGLAGYDVLSPFRLQDGRLILINRGWVPLGASRDVLPSIELPIDGRESVLLREGWASRPSQGLFQQGAFLGNVDSWPRRVQYPDFAAIGEALGEPVVPLLVQLQSGASAAPSTDWPELYAPRWAPSPRIGPATHYGYSAQWLAMAVALGALYAWYGWLRPRRPAG